MIRYFRANASHCSPLPFTSIKFLALFYYFYYDLLLLMLTLKLFQEKLSFSKKLWFCSKFNFTAIIILSSFSQTEILQQKFEGSYVVTVRSHVLNFEVTYFQRTYLLWTKFLLITFRNYCTCTPISFVRLDIDSMSIQPDIWVHFNLQFIAQWFTIFPTIYL